MLSVNPSYAAARVSAYELKKLIHRVPDIDPNTDSGSQQKLAGEIEFRNVRFYYPTRVTQEVLKGISFKISAGSTIGRNPAQLC